MAKAIERAGRTFDTAQNIALAVALGVGSVIYGHNAQSEIPYHSALTEVQRHTAAEHGVKKHAAHYEHQVTCPNYSFKVNSDRQISKAQVDVCLSEAGFRGPALRMMDRIVEIESTRKPGAISDDDAIGLWQMHHSTWIGEGRDKTTTTCALAPKCATNFAYKVISKDGRYFGDWTNWEPGWWPERNTVALLRR